jgi:signal transduction histidine kinase
VWHTLLDREPDRLHDEFHHLQALLADNIREVRRSIFALRPVALEELGFFPALRRLIDDVGQQSQLHVELHVAGPRDRLPPPLEPVLFRIVQEALNNVSKHARASTVWINLDLAGETGTVLTIRDDGTGFDPARLEQAVSHGHLGLKQMQERVAGLGGQFRLESRVGAGTTITVKLESQE